MSIHDEDEITGTDLLVVTTQERNGRWTARCDEFNASAKGDTEEEAIDTLVANLLEEFFLGIPPEELN